MRSINFLSIAIAAMVMLSGCSTRVADLTVASTKNFNTQSGALTSGKRVEGTDRIAVVLIPLGTPSIETAIDNAIESDRCAVGLSDVVLSNKFFVFLVGYVELNVKGNLILDSSQPGCGGTAPSAYAPQRQAPAAQKPATPYSTREQQIQRLQQQNLPYEEYQRRYKEIMGE
ncbi:hypothetical protein [Pseudomonas sp. S9]|uniref:hypothetical protein n=1 Tax=Pseudomonas sp. S9 TaxID=686578 RepID=UPI0002556DD8|nr:hypothetical protein [Pseudomonas sp. S9]